MLKTRKKRTDRQKTEALLDDIYRDYIRMRAMRRVGGCERCRQPKLLYTYLETAHFHPRWKHTVRWDPRNSAGLCADCHRFIDNNKGAKLVLALQILGQAEYERLSELSGKTTKQAPIDHELIEIQLRALLKEV